MASPPVPPPERRLQGRVPFVRRCVLSFGDGRTGQALIVNINMVGAYVAHDDLAGAGAAPVPPPRVGELVTCRFGLPDRADEVELQALVTWVNARQSHPVHSLPPGFGLTFRRLSPRAHAAIEQVMSDAARRTGPA
ncbi:MAG TPA: PilZ domain-containing protein [Vicinamibacteria bacterium]|nr:PilZ domain-containing protein [Vicinamibacteria bacterium]